MFSEKVKYFIWALKNFKNRDLSCPFCKSDDTRLIRRKALITSLWECQSCGLRFRVPQDNSEESYDYYQSRYQQRLVTECPSESELEALVKDNFCGSPLYCQKKIAIFQALSLKTGDTILDFGSSWGYDSFQFSRAGFEVYSLEISQRRAAYAREKLHCQVINRIEDVPKKVKVFYSSHVIEHFPDPNVFWQAACRVLEPEGMTLIYCPNGEPLREAICGSEIYHKLWARDHPLLLNGRALKAMAKHYGFVPYVYCAPLSTEDIRANKEPEQLTGDELLLVARRA